MDVFAHVSGPRNQVELIGAVVDAQRSLLLSDDALGLISLPPSAVSALTESFGENAVVQLRGAFGEGPGVEPGTLSPLAARNSFIVASYEQLGTKLPLRVTLRATSQLGQDDEIRTLASPESARQYADELMLSEMPDTSGINWSEEFLVGLTGASSTQDLLPVLGFIDSLGAVRLRCRELVLLPKSGRSGRDVVLVAVPRVGGVVPEVTAAFQTFAFPSLPESRTATLRAAAEGAASQ
jgi:hypothetical protein